MKKKLKNLNINTSISKPQTEKLIVKELISKFRIYLWNRCKNELFINPKDLTVEEKKDLYDDFKEENKLLYP